MLSLKYSSPGPDDIPAVFLKHAAEEAIYWLLNLHQIIWSQRTFPKFCSSPINIATLILIKTPNETEIYLPVCLSYLHANYLKRSAGDAHSECWKNISN